MDILHTPSGVRDILGFEYKNKYDLYDNIYNVMTGFGYSMIDTPVFEYIECFSKDIGSCPDNELYKITDKEGYTLALRPEYTPSIARVSAKYFNDAAGAIKLGYRGKVYRNYSSHTGKQNESTQLGAEYIGDGFIDADAETIALAINCLLCTGSDQFKISLGHSGIISSILKELSLSEKEEERFLAFIKNKNFYGLNDFLDKRNNDKKIRDIVNLCIDTITDENSIDELIEKTKDFSDICEYIFYLKELYAILKVYDVHKYVSIDLSLTSDYKYYTGIIFYGYTYGSGNAVLSGGRYDKLLSHFGKDAPAIGFAINIDDLMEAMKREGYSRYLYEPKDVILYEGAHRIEAIKNSQRMRKNKKCVLLVKYEGDEELNKYKEIYRNDNVYLITGKENHEQ